MAPRAAAPPARRRKRMSGMTWIFLAVVIFFISGGLLTQIIRQVGHGINAGTFAPPAALRSYAGVTPFETVDGGVTFDNIEAPGSPADKAELVGGDVITTFDGQPVTDDDEMMDAACQDAHRKNRRCSLHSRRRDEDHEANDDFQGRP